ncbi:hypothetical protein C8Q75DRAFT_807990 [Abortiporus biennis]|nr:hypothetical protein C8Q75DRAFT_807990 [Abortiporus biennis]
MLNQYFAQMYHGKLLVRFDGPSPTEERIEFKETTVEDMALLDIHSEIITHTSDLII